MLPARLLAIWLALIAHPGAHRPVEAGSVDPWSFPSNLSPAQSSASLSIRSGMLSQLRGLPEDAEELLSPQREQQGKGPDWVPCSEPSLELFNRFSRLYNRTFHDDQRERSHLFEYTFVKAIALNDILHRAVTNKLNYRDNERAATIANYYYIETAEPALLWYADLNDCELGLIKKLVFELFYLVEQNNLADAYEFALMNSAHLPVLSLDGFEQLANLLLVRLYDRFSGDQQMGQLFRWPEYLHKLAAYAYHKRLQARPDYEERLALVSFLYPTFYRDVRYHVEAANTTADNLQSQQQHIRFNRALGRKFETSQDLTRRIINLRRRIALYHGISKQSKGLIQVAGANYSIHQDWTRLDNRNLPPPPNLPFWTLESEEERQDGFEQIKSEGKLGESHFSDLSDAEFVALISADNSLLDPATANETVKFFKTNFAPQELSSEYRWKLATEIQFRRFPEDLRHGTRSDRLDLTRRVVDELIGEVGLPFGAVETDEQVNDAKLLRIFVKVAARFKKPYYDTISENFQTEVRPSDLQVETQKRYLRFMKNYGRFQAWATKEGLQWDEQQQVALLRFADMSWSEIKLVLFKLCCLDQTSLKRLSSQNSTILYLSSHREVLCLPYESSQHAYTDSLLTYQGQSSTLDGENLEDLRQKHIQHQRMALVELYYYYSVHFGKHHLDLDSTERSLAVFRHNVEQIRRLSCARSLSLSQALEQKLGTDALNGLDSLDSWQIRQADVNLDRFRYFLVPDLRMPASHQQHLVSDSGSITQPLFNVLEREILEKSWTNFKPITPGVVYMRRETPLSSLLARLSSVQLTSAQNLTRLVQINQRIVAMYHRDAQSLASEQYRRNNAARVYDLVIQRYRQCLETSGRDYPRSNYPKCRARVNKFAEEMQDSDDNCGYYMAGLASWSLGLLEPSTEYTKRINSARCPSIQSV